MYTLCSILLHYAYESHFFFSHGCVHMGQMGFIHTGQCKRTGGCYNELVVAFLSTGGGVKGKKSIPVGFMIYLQTCIYFICDDTWRTDHR